MELKDFPRPVGLAGISLA